MDRSVLNIHCFFILNGVKMLQKAKGRPVEYDETKKQISLTLTPTAIAILEQKTQEFNCRNKSQLVEKWLRQQL